MKSDWSTSCVLSELRSDPIKQDARVGPVSVTQDAGEDGVSDVELLPCSGDPSVTLGLK